MSVAEAIGLGGAGLAAYAYVPQIAHLVREHCSAGLSERAYTLWLVSSALMTVHAVTIGSVVFVLLGCQQIVATGLVAFFCARYRDQACPSHDSTHWDRRLSSQGRPAGPHLTGHRGKRGASQPEPA